MAHRIVLLHSPLLGALTWQAVGAELTARGHRVAAPAWPRLLGIDGDFYRALATAMAPVLAEAPAVVVVHSGAGALVPALEAASANVAAVIFADAILPHPGRSWFDTAPPDLATGLRGGADFGELPAWDRWWPPGALERLVPDPEIREPLLAELEPLPLQYFEEPAPPASLTAPAAYLRLSGAYDEEARLAGLQGWPVVSHRLHHLAMLTHAPAVATAIEGLVARLEAGHG